MAILPVSPQASGACTRFGGRRRRPGESRTLDRGVRASRLCIGRPV